MRIDNDLHKMLVEKTANHTDIVPVFKIRNQNADEMHNEAIKLALPYTNASMAKELRFNGVQKGNHILLQLHDNATLQYFPASGYKCFQKNTPGHINAVSGNANETNKDEFVKAAQDILEKNGLNLSGSMERLCFENLFQLKSAGISQHREATPVVLNRLVYAYRRFVNDLPVLGSASVFIKTAAEYKLEGFGIDWRYIYDAPVTIAKIIEPKDAAVRALEHLHNINHERIYTPDEIEPVSFELGYFSHSKSMYQTVLQPVYVAKFIFKGKFRMGHVVTVPAAGTAYESICRKVTPPPFNSARRDVKYQGDKKQPYQRYNTRGSGC